MIHVPAVVSTRRAADPTRWNTAIGLSTDVAVVFLSVFPGRVSSVLHSRVPRRPPVLSSARIHRPGIEDSVVC